MKNSNIEAIVFDLAGTLIDFGSLAPSQVLIKLFDRLGIKITRKQAIGPMGIEKRAHIKALLTTRKINSQWKKKFKSKPTDKDIDKLFKLFNPELKKIIKKHSKFISGSKNTIDFIKKKNKNRSQYWIFRRNSKSYIAGIKKTKIYTRCII